MARLLRLAQTATDIVGTDGSRAFAADQSMGSNKLTSLADGTVDSDGVNLGQLNAALLGLNKRAACDTDGYVGNATIAVIDGLTPTAGDTYVATSAGTPSAGTSDALVIGSVAQFDGTSWIEIVAGSGGFVADGVRLIVSTSVTLISPLTDATDDGKIVDFDGTSLTPDLTLGEATDGATTIIKGEGAVNENQLYVFDGAVPTGTWISVGLGLADTFSTIVTDSGTSPVASGSDTLNLLGGDGLTTVGVAGTDTVTTDLVLDGDSMSKSGAGVKSSVPVGTDKELTPAASGAVDEVSTTLAITSTPGGDGMPDIYVNGQLVELGLGVKTADCYFSSDGGTTPKALAAITAADVLYWNGVLSTLGPLLATDVIDMSYAA